MKRILILIVSFIVLSCNHAGNRYDKDKTIETLKELSPGNDFSKKSIVLIIPFDGCSSCFNEAVHLIPEISEKNNIVIMPNRHERRVYNFLNDFGLSTDEVIVDTMQLTVLNNLVDINPVVLVVENEVVIFRKLVEVENMKEIKSVLSE